jgi:hypothetical protein
VVDYLRQFFSFNFQWQPFAFHSDELCGHHHGTLTGDVSMTGNSIGDPHQHTVNGVSYDFQAVGEFTLLRDGDDMEVQVRQTPVATTNTITDSYSGLTVCVSINTAVAARVGARRIAYQPGTEGRRLQFYLDGKPSRLSKEGLDLEGHRVAVFDANGETGLRVDYDDGTILLVTPKFWNSYNVWYLDVSVSNTRADEGTMGHVPKESWLPRLRSGESVGMMPTNLADRYAVLYKTFADSWRVTDQTSLFVYAPGTSTKTFTDPDWPGETPPCEPKPEFQIPGAPILEGMPIAEAEDVCRIITMKDLYNNCVFDVAATGDKIFAETYLLAQELRLYGTSVEISASESLTGGPDRTSVVTGGDAPADERGLTLVVKATVKPMTPGRPTPTGSVTFFVDGMPMNRAATLDARGRARVSIGPLRPGTHKIMATYSGGGKYEYYSSSSPNLLYRVRKPRVRNRPR